MVTRLAQIIDHFSPENNMIKVRWDDTASLILSAIQSTGALVEEAMFIADEIRGYAKSKAEEE